MSVADLAHGISPDLLAIAANQESAAFDDENPDSNAQHGKPLNSQEDSLINNSVDQLMLDIERTNPNNDSGNKNQSSK